MAARRTHKRGGRDVHQTDAAKALTVQRYTSVTEWYRYCENAGDYVKDGGSDKFYGHVSPRDAVRHCEQGIGEHEISAAKELVNKIDASFRDRERDAWVPAPMGAYPIVPDFLAGDPFPMRQKCPQENDAAPIRYFIECVISAGTHLDELERRATGIAALIMRTVEIRPVELYAIVALSIPGEESYKGYLATIRIETHPIDLYSTIAAFATREFCRTMAFAGGRRGVDSKTSGTIHWLFGNPEGFAKGAREISFRRELGMEPQDVLIQGGYLADASLFRSDPVQWVHNQIEKQRSIEA